MKLTIDLCYILKRIIIGTGIALAIMFFKSNVFAQNCSSTGSWIGYYDSSNNYVSAQNTTSRTYNGFGKGFSFGNLNNNIQNKSFVYSAKFSVTYNEYVIMDSVPSLTITLKDSSHNSQDITSSCYTSTKKICTAISDGLCYEPIGFEYNIICSAKSNLSGGREINVYSRFNDIAPRDVSYTTTFERLLDCLVISPSDKDEIIANNEANTQEILDQNYNYYNSLLDHMTDFENRQSEFISEWGEILDNAMIRYKNQIIANQNANTQAISDILTDSDVGSGILGKGASFFGQDIDTAGNGLVSVITSPITILQRATDTCSAKSFVLFGNTITLPCGSTLFWEKDFSNYDSIFSSGLTGTGLNTARNDFRLFWNIFFGGAIIFHLLVKLFMVVSDALDPDSCTVRSINSAIDTSDVSSYVPKHSYEVTESKRQDFISHGGSRSLKNRDIYVGSGGVKYYG